MIGFITGAENVNTVSLRSPLSPAEALTADVELDVAAAELAALELADFDELDELELPQAATSAHTPSVAAALVPARTAPRWCVSPRRSPRRARREPRNDIASPLSP
jgi:hypothetical protein